MVGRLLGRGTIDRSYLCERRGNVMFEVSGLEHVLPGTPVAYLDRLSLVNGHLSAQLDNIVTVAMLVHIFRCGFEGTAFFTAQEEAGRSWRFLYEWFRRAGLTTDRLLVLDTSPFGDRESADAQQLVLRRRDANAPFNVAMADNLEELCARRGISYLFKDAMLQDRTCCALRKEKRRCRWGALNSAAWPRRRVAKSMAPPCKCRRPVITRRTKPPRWPPCSRRSPF